MNKDEFSMELQKSMNEFYPNPSVKRKQTTIPNFCFHQLSIILVCQRVANSFGIWTMA